MRYCALFLLLAACSTSAVHMAAPDGHVVQCGPYETIGSGHEMVAAMRERGCIDDYMRQGFVRVP